MRSDLSQYCWARDVTPRFNVQNPVRVRDSRSVYPTEYLEGEGTDRRTGKRVFVGMNAFLVNGIVRNVVATAPDEAAFHQLFPQPNDLERMMTYNKFAVGPSDLTGNWSSTSNQVTEMVYRETGLNAGMNINTSSTEFFINADGSYTSKHVGAYNIAGTTKVYSDTYTGRYTTNGNWQVTFTNRHKGVAETFAAEFEIVPGGRILRLMNVESTGIRFNLRRVP
jgi:hypothetical protein